MKKYCIIILIISVCLFIGCDGIIDPEIVNPIKAVKTKELLIINSKPFGSYSFYKNSYSSSTFQAWYESMGAAIHDPITCAFGGWTLYEGIGNGTILPGNRAIVIEQNLLSYNPYVTGSVSLGFTYDIENEDYDGGKYYTAYTWSRGSSFYIPLSDFDETGEAEVELYDKHYGIFAILVLEAVY